VHTLAGFLGFYLLKTFLCLSLLVQWNKAMGHWEKSMILLEDMLPQKGHLSASITHHFLAS